MGNKNDTQDDKISKFMRDPKRVAQALQSGVNAALLKHKQAGNPVCGWKDGKIIWVSLDKVR